MANSKDNLSKYGKGFIGFDEPSGNAFDTIGGWTGTVTGATRIAGWNGKGYAMNFNGINQYVEFNNPVIPIGAKSIRFKIKQSTPKETILITNAQSTSYGIDIWTNLEGKIQVYLHKNTGWSDLAFSIASTKLINDGMWHDVLFTWDGTTNTNGVKLYVDNMNIADATSTAKTTETVNPTLNLRIGKHASSATAHVNDFNGQLDAIEIYNRIISPIPDKYLVQHNSQYKYHNGTAWMTTTATEANFKLYGMSQLSQITETQWKELVGAKFLAMWTDFEDKQWASAVLNIEPVKVSDLLGDNPEVVYYSDAGVDAVTIETEVEPFSVYDYIGELPTVVTYADSTEDIIIETKVEPFTIYDQFKDSVDVLYYTEVATTTGGEAILEANWTPIDEIDGNFDVITWTDDEDGQRNLEKSALPVPQFIHSVSANALKNGLLKLLAKDLSSGELGIARFLLTADQNTWYTFKQDNFFPVTLTNENIIVEGLTSEQLNALTPQQLSHWTQKSINIGVFLSDDIRKPDQAKVTEIGYQTEVYSDSPAITDVNFYILNTTATISIDLSGLTLTGQVDDDDMTRVQYRVLLNDVPYYPADGQFTPLSAPPLNIDMTFRSDEIKIGDWNTVRVEFQDYFGTMDYWEAQFVGKYAGLMFMNEANEYYSTDLGAVLQYLDFGQMLTGQVSVAHEIKVENTYGFDLTDVKIAVNTTQFAQGLSAQLGLTETDLNTVQSLPLGNLADGDSTTFFIRLVSTVNAIPNNSTTFNIVATANRKITRN